MEAFERERERYARQTEMIKRKVEDVQYPLQQLEISYTDPTQCKDYSIYEDRFLLVEIAKYGVGQDDVYQRIKRDIDECPAFRFDRFMTSRTLADIANRCRVLISLVEEEVAGAEAGGSDRGSRMS